MPKKMTYRLIALSVSVSLGVMLALLGLFALGASATRAAVNTEGVDLVKTVGLDRSACATTGAIDVALGTEVTYCYEVTNTGTENLITHDLVDDRLGTILAGFPYVLAPSARVFLTQTAVISKSVINTATWSALSSDGGTASDEATAQVTVLPPSLTLTKTVGTDAMACAATDAIEVGPFARVTYCYEVTNTGLDPLVVHDLVDDRLGTILADFPYVLAPSASAFLTETVVISDSVINTATWSADTADGRTASGGDTAQVTVVPPSLTLTKTVGTDATACAATDAIEVEPNARVTYCYEVINTGLDALVVHDLVDDRLGTILADFPYVLAPSARAFLTETVVISESVINTATWSALTAESVEASDSDTATVLVAGDPLYDLFPPMLNH